MDPTTDPALRSWVPAPPDSHFPIQNLPFGVFYWPGRGVKNFVGESWAELKKVEWPRQNQLIQGVVVVLVACIVVGVYLYANDLVWKRFVQNVLLR